MFQNYLTTAVRNLFRHRLFSTINILGLAIGLSAVMLISLYIWDELTFDSYFADNGNIYKAEMTMPSPSGGERKLSVTGGALAGALQQDFGEQFVEASARLMEEFGIVTIADQPMKEVISRVDASFFSIFKLDYVEGNGDRSMTDLSSVVLSQSTARRYFGDQKALGQIVDLDDGESYRVSAVFRDPPANTHLELNALFPLKPSDYDRLDHDSGWWRLGYYTYFTIGPGADIDALHSAIPTMIDRYVAPAEFDNRPSGERYQVRLIALKDVHFETSASDQGNPMLLTGFGAIALTILGIATFNFMNMSISRTVGRAREVAVRKAVGANRGQIIGQFMSETLTTVLIAFVIAIAITELALPWFNDFVAKLMSSGVLITPLFVTGLVCLLAIVALGAGYYPAFIMSRFRPADVLRGGKSDSRSLSHFRTALVTAQFAVAIGLMIAATVVYQQIGYSQSMDPGYVKENVVLIHDLDHPTISASAQSFKNRLLEHPDVVSASLVDQAPGGSYSWISGVTSVGGRSVQSVRLRGMKVDSGFLDTLGMKLRAGRVLSSERPADFTRRLDTDYLSAPNVLINEEAARTLGLGTPENAIGKTFVDSVENTIVGVIGDYLIGSSRGNVPAMYYVMDEQGYRILALRFQTSDVAGLMSFIDTTWAEIAGDHPIRHEFLDERVASLYGAEEQQGQIFALFAGLSVLVSCIGLYGLASFSVAQRTKEIGLRKALGASATIITRRIMWDFSKPVLIANIIAWPIAGYFMSDWLTNFNYRVDLGVLPFGIAAALALVVAWATVGGHALRVARANPINALRCE